MVYTETRPFSLELVGGELEEHRDKSLKCLTSRWTWTRDDMEKKPSVTKSRPVPKPRKSLVKSPSTEKPDPVDLKCPDDVFQATSDEKEVRQNEENERKLKSVRSRSYEVALEDESLDIVIPNSMEMCAEEGGDGYLQMGPPLHGGSKYLDDQPVPLRQPPKSHSFQNFQEDDNYMNPSITGSVPKSQTSDALGASVEKLLPTRPAPHPPKVFHSRGPHSFDDTVKVKEKSNDVILKERPKSTVWYGETSTDELDHTIPILTESSAWPDADVKLPTKKQKTSYRPSLIGSHIMGQIKSWTSPNKSEKHKSSIIVNRSSKFYVEAQEEDNKLEKKEDVESESSHVPPPLPPPRQNFSSEAPATAPLVNTPPIPAPRPRLSVFQEQVISNETPPLPPPRSKRNSKLPKKESHRGQSRESLDTVGERSELKESDSASETQCTDGEQNDDIGVKNVDSAGYFDLSQQVLHDKSINPDSPAGKQSSSGPKVCYANLTSNHEPFNDLDVIIPPSGGVLPSSSPGDSVFLYSESTGMVDNPVYNTELPSQTELISADLDLDVVVYEDTDSEDSDPDYFAGYMEPSELDKSRDNMPPFKGNRASKKSLVVPTMNAPALPPRTRSPSPAKPCTQAPLASVHSELCDNSDIEYIDFVERHSRMSKRFSSNDPKESSDIVESDCVIDTKEKSDMSQMILNEDAPSSQDSFEHRCNIISETEKELHSVASEPTKESEMSGASGLSENMFGHARCTSLSSIESDDSGDDVTTPLGDYALKHSPEDIHRSHRGGSTLKPSRKLAEALSSSDSSSGDSLHTEIKSLSIAHSKQKATGGSADLGGLVLGTPPRVVLRRKPVTSHGSSDGDSRPTSWASVSSAGSDLPPMAHLYLGEHQQHGGTTTGSLGDVSVRSSMSSLDQSGGEEEDQVDAEKSKEMKRRKKQFYVAQEIMTSERTFLDILKLLNVDYRQVIAKSSEAIRAPVVPPNVLSQLLRHLPEMHKFSETLLHDLTERIQNWDKNPKVADIFVRMGAFLKLYTAYIMDFESKCALLDENRKKYMEFDRCTTIFEASARCHKMNLQHFMLKPVQRLPQYRLLLRDYQKCLSKDNPDCKDTEAALAIVTEVAEHANQSMKYGDDLNKLLEIQNSLVGRFEVIKPGRYLVKEGELMKLSRKEMQPRYFFLLNDILLYATPYTAPYAVSNYRLNNAIPLVGMKVKVPDKQDHQNEFSIISKQRSFTICGKTPEEKDAWLKVLRETIAENDAKKKSFIQLESEPASPESPVSTISPLKKVEFRLGSQHPVWIPDSRVSMCMLCTGEFTVAFRRHHCRSCGKVVCGFCSDFKAPLEYLDFKAGRVCKDCYGKLRRETRSSLSSVDKAKVEEAKGMLGKFSKSSYGIRSKLLKITETQMHRVSQIRETLGKGSWTKPQALKEVSSADQGALISGYLRLWKDKKWVKVWYVVKGKVLYSFKGSEDTAATNSTVLLGYECRPFLSFFQGVSPQLLFELIHKGLPNMLFATENPESKAKWMKCIRDASIP